MNAECLGKMEGRRDRNEMLEDYMRYKEDR